MPVFYSEPKNTNEDNTLTSNAIALGMPENVDTFYIIGTGIAAVQWSGFTGEINTAKKVLGYDDKDYLLYSFKDKSSDPKTLTFTAKPSESINIETLFLFETLFRFPDEDTFIRLDMSNTERGAVIHEDLYYDLSKVQGYFKNEVEYTAEDQTYEQKRKFDIFRMNNPHFYFLEDFDSFDEMPEKLYAAILGVEVNYRYSILLKTEGFNIDFSVSQR